MFMTRLVYLHDPYKRSLESEIEDIGTRGNQTWVILRETVFYPEGGGQPADQGLIKGEGGALEVTQVAYGGGKPLHFGKLSGELNKGEKVSLEINWERRYRNMQIHSAGHVIHEAVKELAPEVEPLEGDHGKHPRIKYHGVVDQLLREEIESKANDIIAKNLEITYRFVTPDELRMLLTNIPDYLPKNKQLRVIQIGSYPPTPDGGTQVKRTGEIPTVIISSIEYDGEGDSVVNYEVAKEEAKATAGVMPTDKEIDEFNRLKIRINELVGKDRDKKLLRLEILGKRGLLHKTFKEVLTSGKYDKGSIGQSFNKLKSEVEEMFETKEGVKSGRKEANFDLTLPGTPMPVGLLHPVNAVAREMNEIFHGLGFSVADGPELETDEYNYNRLNLPMDHPARDLQDSLYIKEPDILLRTHTSSVEAHILADQKPPYRFVFPGKCYRFENVNASNHMMFYQYQGLAVGEKVTMANLKSTFNTFLKKFYGEETVSRFRCKYYPEVEPGVGVDIGCPFCRQKGCSVCKFRGWIEISGAGMVHPNMLKRVGLDPEKYSGFAFGMGLDRVAMTRYGINDIRALFNGDLVYKT